MNRSIEFKMSRCEEKNLIDFINSNSDIAMIAPTSENMRPKTIREFYKENENMFWNKVYIALQEDVDKIRMCYVKSCNHYIIEDTYEAPVIEIRRNKSDNNPNSRLYAELYCYKDGENVYKGEKFEKLYKKIETWIKINYVDCI